MVHLTRRYRFSAAHRLHNEALSAEENVGLYGKCNNPRGHGHEYVLEVTVTGEVDPQTGMVMDLGLLDRLVEREVLDRFDHMHLNLDVANFRERVPTTENPTAVMIAVTIMAPRNTERRSARPITHGRTVNRVTAGTAVMMPIQDASMPTERSHNGKNGR